MSRNVYWNMVEPRVAAEKERLKEALTEAPPEQILKLQAQYAALSAIEGWFRAGAIDEMIFSENV